MPPTVLVLNTGLSHGGASIWVVPPNIEQNHAHTRLLETTHTHKKEEEEERLSGLAVKSAISWCG